MSQYDKPVQVQSTESSVPAEGSSLLPQLPDDEGEPEAATARRGEGVSGDGLDKGKKSDNIDPEDATKADKKDEEKPGEKVVSTLNPDRDSHSLPAELAKETELAI